MPVIDTTKGFSNRGRNPIEKLTKALQAITTAMVDAKFIDEKSGKVIIDRPYLEMIIDEYAVTSQAPQIVNKFLSEDEKLNKALRTFKSNISMLLASITQQGAMQGAIAGQAPAPSMPTQPAGAQPAPAPTPNPQASSSAQLPTDRGQGAK